MINPNDYRHHDLGDFSYVTMEMVRLHHSGAAYDNFKQWMTGQPCGVTEDGKESAIYSWDYERWERQGKKTAQNSNDWD